MGNQFDAVSDVGQRLKAFRLDAGLSPEDVARETGISRAAIYRYEAGQPMRIDTLGKIADLLNVSLPSLLGVGVEYIPSALRFFERMRQIEVDVDHISALFGPVSYLLTTGAFDSVLAEVLAESVPQDVRDRRKALDEIAQLVEILKSRKAVFQNRRPHILSLVSAAEMAQFVQSGFVGCAAPAGADLAKRHDIAAIEVRNVIRLLREQPIGVQVGVVVDSMPGTSFQIFKQTNRSPVAISPFTLGSFANVRIGVATITTAQEAVDLYIEMTERLWRRSLKGDEAADYIEKLAFRS